MDSQLMHGMVAVPDHDEASRQEFSFTLRSHVINNVFRQNRQAWEVAVEPGFRKHKGREAQNRHEIKPLMVSNPFFQMSSSLRQIQQEYMWDVYGEKIHRHLPELIERARNYRDNPKRKGSLRLDPSLTVPRYHTAVDIHTQPGGYHTDSAADDVFCGALYDDAIWTFLMHGQGPLNDLRGRCMIDYLKANFPEFRPRRILDMGCTVGHSTLAFVDAWPDAEVHAIDVAAPCVRYAHGRAESLGKRVHFSQQNAEKTDFPDGYFDLVVSVGMLHETSRKAFVNVFGESHRLLAPGGIMMHTDQPSKAHTTLLPDAFAQFIRDWDTHYNAEPFIGTMMDMDHVAAAARAGFDPTTIRDEDFRSPARGGVDHLVLAVR